jgi:hypothetical protein
VTENALVVEGDTARRGEIGRDVRALLHSLDLDAAAPDGMIGSMASIPLPADRGGAVHDTQALHDWLRAHGVEAWLHSHPVPLVRVSAQLYNRLDQFQHLAALLEEALRECRT